MSPEEEDRPKVGFVSGADEVNVYLANVRDRPVRLWVDGQLVYLRAPGAEAAAAAEDDPDAPPEVPAPLLGLVEPPSGRLIAEAIAAMNARRPDRPVTVEEVLAAEVESLSFRIGELEGVLADLEGRPAAELDEARERGRERLVAFGHLMDDLEAMAAALPAGEDFPRIQRCAVFAFGEAFYELYQVGRELELRRAGSPKVLDRAATTADLRRLLYRRVGERMGLNGAGEGAHVKRLAERGSIRPPRRGYLAPCARCGLDVVHSKATGLPFAQHLNSKACASSAPAMVSVTFAVTEKQRRGLARNHPCAGDRATDEEMRDWALATVVAWLGDLDLEADDG